ncbi:Zinc finger, BED-type [Sesbania bispinosa]|nr:Zinc finger, BED-type [Sesbania bispinosa]
MADFRWRRNCGRHEHGGVAEIAAMAQNNGQTGLLPPFLFSPKLHSHSLLLQAPSPATFFSGDVLPPTSSDQIFCPHSSVSIFLHPLGLSIGSVFTALIPIMATQTTSSSQSSRTNNRTDPGWKYCHSLTEGDTQNIVCNFCEKVTRGGITRAKNHLTGSSNNVKACPKCPKEVQEELKQYATDKKKQNSFEIPNVRELDLENTGFGESEDELDNYRDFLPPSSATGKKNVAKKGPMDLFCRKPETAIEKRKKEKLRQTSIREACDKEAKARVHQHIARFWY